MNNKNNQNDYTNNGIIDYDKFYNKQKKNRNNLKKIKIGKGQKFRLYNSGNLNNNNDNNNNKYELWLIPIFYDINEINEINDINDINEIDLMIKSVRVNIQSPLKKYMKRNIIDLLLYDSSNNENMNQFTNAIIAIENKIKKKVSKISKYNLENKNYHPIIKYDEFYKSQKMSLIVDDSCPCYDINNVEIPNWNFKCPTFGYFVFHIKNIWIKGNEWGINLNCEGSMILPSQMSNAPRLGRSIKCLFAKEMISSKTVADLDEYKTFFKMKKMGIPEIAIKQKIKLVGLNSDIISYNLSDPISKLESDLGIKLLPDNLKTTSNSDNNNNHIHIHISDNHISDNSLNKNNNNNNNVSELKFDSDDLKNQSLKLKKVNQSKKDEYIKIANSDPRIPNIDDIKKAMTKLKSIKNNNY